MSSQITILPNGRFPSSFFGKKIHFEIQIFYLALSSLTHFSGPLAVTVAALGRLVIRAISPK